MRGHDLERIMRAKNRRDIRRATQTWERRCELRARRKRNQKWTQVFFVVGGLVFGGLGSFTEILLLLWFGLLGPLMVRYELM
jgi:hypothetical protein